ncbi:MAG TPA: hypothetical protein O0X23_01875 [Methanocorpusculum sp.]|nr:hypothetical protein [Methanocorpusculum sp.]
MCSCVVSAAGFTAAKVAADDAELFAEFVSVSSDCSAADAFGKSADEFFEVVVENDAVSPFFGNFDNFDLGYTVG